jgi:hypothetical protein
MSTCFTRTANSRKVVLRHVSFYLHLKGSKNDVVNESLPEQVDVRSVLQGS